MDGKWVGGIPKLAKVLPDLVERLRPTGNQGRDNARVHGGQLAIPVESLGEEIEVGHGIGARDFRRCTSILD
jgi:hypothetical protein